MIRRSSRPSKQLLFLMLSKDMKSSQSYNIGLDLACGKMYNRGMFKTKKYIGIDIDEERIRKGLRKFPSATGLVYPLEDLPSTLEGDFVVCVQTIGINNYFDVKNTMNVINKIVESVNQNGVLIFNVGPKALELYERKIDELLVQSFSGVKKTEYGRWTNETNKHLSLLLGVLMYIIPLLRKGKTRFAYYICHNKR